MNDYTQERKQLACMLAVYVDHEIEKQGLINQYGGDCLYILKDCVDKADTVELIMEDDTYIDSEKTMEWAYEWAKDYVSKLPERY